MNKQRNIWDVFYDRRDEWESHKTTLVAIDNKWRYITEVDTLPWEVFAEETLDWAEEENESDWIDDVRAEMMWKPVYWVWLWQIKFRDLIEKHMPKQDLIPLDLEKIKDAMQNIKMHIDTRYTNFDTIWWEIKQILSKYGTTPQKKLTREIISSRVEYNKDRLLTPYWYIQQFLEYNWLLED